jgi:hypothetical protein
MRWFIENRADLAAQISFMACDEFPNGDREHLLLAIPSRARLERVLDRLFDENEFLSPFGFRSVSRYHAENPLVMWCDGIEHRVDYSPGESETWLFGGNSNWRGPIWFPVNYLLVEALERYAHFYGDRLTVEFPSRSGQRVSLNTIVPEIHHRLASIFLPDSQGRCPYHGDDPHFERDPHWRDIVCFHEYFHGDTGRGIGAAHQTGWTALVATCLEHLARYR